MIPEFCIIEWRANAPWNENFQVEQDLIISRALIDLYSNDLIKKNLAFRGGTALNKLFLKPAARYSEDIDLVQLKKQPIGEIINAVRNSLSWLGEPQRRLTERSVKLIYKYNSIDNIPKKLKIEINITEHFQLYELEEYEFEINNSWFEGKASIMTYNINELMGTKLRALYQRRKGRDLFDIWAVMKKGMIDSKIVVNTFLKYCANDGQLITRAIFERNFDEKVAHQEFQYDIISLLPQNVLWSLEEAVTIMKKEIITFIPGKAYQSK